MKKQLINLNPIKEQVKEKLLEKYNETLFMNTNKIELKLDVEDILDKYIEEQHLVEPTVYITPNAYIKMRLLVDKCDKEVGWYGIVNKMPGLEASYIIEDIIVYPQRVTGATVEQDDNEIFNFEMSLTTEQVNHKRFHGHSHVNMGTGPSGVDENFYQDLLTQVTDYYIITITNKRNEYTTRFYDIANNILYTDVPIQLMQEDGTLYSDWFDTNKELIKEHTYTTSIFKETAKEITTVSKNKYAKQESLFKDDLPFYDPYVKEWITPDEYEDIYNAPYRGEYDSYNYSKKGSKKHGKNRS